MIAVDASVAVAAFGDWHRRNPEACAVLDQGAALPAHVLLEGRLKVDLERRLKVDRQRSCRFTTTEGGRLGFRAPS